MSQPVNVKFI